MMSLSRTANPSRTHLTSLMYSLPVRRLKEILSHVVPDATLGLVEEEQSPQLPRLYILSMSDGRKLILSFAPSLAVRLLRHEATMLSSEAILADFVAGTGRRTGTLEFPRGQAESPLPSTEVVGLVPKLLKHSSNNREMAYPYSIFEMTAGSTLSSLSVYLSLPERRFVDRQIGSMARGLASLMSPHGTFGRVNRVLPDPFTAMSPIAGGNIRGSETWSVAFNLLLEGVLRDGEDMAVLLPYEVIRAHYQRLSWRLDAVTLPRLVIIDAGSETNVMIVRGLEERASMVQTETSKVTGLRSWSQGIFGDPLVSDCFENPSEGFWEGWRAGGEDIIEDQDNAQVRLLLYQCYRATVSIVTEYYRPQGDSSRRELEGRRKLTKALAELDKVDTRISEILKRARSLSADDESSKRQKLEVK
jgi:hypothetical protein